MSCPAAMATGRARATSASASSFGRRRPGPGTRARRGRRCRGSGPRPRDRRARPPRRRSRPGIPTLGKADERRGGSPSDGEQSTEPRRAAAGRVVPPRRRRPPRPAPGGTRVALVNFPNHANAGDSAIWLGALASLRRMQVHVAYRASWATYEPTALRRALGDGVVLLQGGGNFGDLYPANQQATRERVLADLADVRTIQLPQSLHFDDPANLERMRRLCEAPLGLHPARAGGAEPGLRQGALRRPRRALPGPGPGPRRPTTACRTRGSTCCTWPGSTRRPSPPSGSSRAGVTGRTGRLAGRAWTTSPAGR